MVGEVAHHRGANVEAQGGVAVRVVLDDSAHVGGEPGKGSRSGLSLDGQCILVIDEARADLGEYAEVVESRSQANAEQALHHGLSALLAGDKVKCAVETDSAGDVVVKVAAQSRQVLAAKSF